MAMPFYVSPEQRLKDMADYARKGIARGRPTIVLEYDVGVLFVADNVSTHLRKIGELYDRIAFAAVGRFSEFETLRQAGVRLADIRGYAYGREDVTSRSIANAYSQTLGQVFMQEPKPYEVELCVAELGVEGEPNALYHVSFDGTVVDRKDWLAMGGQVEALNEAMTAAYQEGWKLDAALQGEVEGRRTVRPPNGEGGGRAIGVRERGPSRRAFRRLSDENFAETAAGKAPDGA